MVFGFITGEGENGASKTNDAPPPCAVTVDVVKDDDTDGAKMEDAPTPLKSQIKGINTNENASTEHDETSKTNNNFNIVSTESVDCKELIESTEIIESTSKKRTLPNNDENADAETCVFKRSKLEGLNESKATTGTSPNTAEKTPKMPTMTDETNIGESDSRDNKPITRVNEESEDLPSGQASKDKPEVKSTNKNLHVDSEDASIENAPHIEIKIDDSSEDVGKIPEDSPHEGSNSRRSIPLPVVAPQLTLTSLTKNNPTISQKGLDDSPDGHKKIENGKVMSDNEKSASKTKESQDTNPGPTTKESHDANTGPTIKESQDANTRPTTKESQDANTGPTTKESQDANIGPTTKESQDANTGPTTKESQDANTGTTSNSNTSAKQTLKVTPKERTKPKKASATPKLSGAKLQSALSVVTSHENMASVFNDKGLHDKALSLYRKALDSKINALGKNDKAIGESYLKIGEVLLNKGDYKKALKEYRKAHRILEAALGKKHPELANCKDKIGLLHYDRYNYDDAYNMFIMAMEIRESVLGIDHADTAKSHNNIGMVLSAKDEHTEALVHFRQALKIKEKISGPRHPETATCYDAVGGALRDSGKFNEALIEFQKAFKIRVAQLGKLNKETAISHNNLGTVLLKLKDLNAALSEFRKALSIRENVLGKNHPDTGASHEHVGAVLLEKGDDEGALTSFRKALNIVRESANQKGRLIDTLHNNIGELHFKKGNYTGALECYRETLKNVEAVKGKGHPDTAACYDKIGSVLQAKGDLDEALEEFQKALEIRESVSENGNVAPFNRDDDDSDEDDESEGTDAPSVNTGADAADSSPDGTKTEKTAGLNVLFEAAMQHDDKGKKPGATGGAYTDAVREERDRQSKPAKKRYVEKPQNIDVRFERGGGGNNHPGNKRYLNLVKGERPVYQALNTNTKEKLEISMKIVREVNDYGGLFLKQDEDDGNKRYYILSTDEARKKVMQALREKPKEPKQSGKKRTPSLDADATGLDAVAAAATNAARRRTALRGRPARMHKPKQYVATFSDLDVRCERGGGGNNHPGNKRYLQLVNDMKPAYLSLPDTAKKAKHDLSLAIVNKIVTSGGRFLEMEKISGTGHKRYYQLSESEARIKVSQALRDKPKRKPNWSTT